MKRILLILGIVIAGMTTAMANSEDTSKPSDPQGVTSKVEKRHKDDPAFVEKRMKEVQEYKMKYIAQELELSELQKKKFFEVYEEMMNSKKECFSEAVKLERQLRHEKNATEENYQQVTDAFNKANMQWAETEKTYNEKFSEFLTQKQIYKMREAENNFRAKFDEMKHKRRKK